MDIFEIGSICSFILLFFNNVFVLIGLNMIAEERSVSSNILSYLAISQTLYGIFSIAAIHSLLGHNMGTYDGWWVELLCDVTRGIYTLLIVVCAIHRLVKVVSGRDLAFGKKKCILKIYIGIIIVSILSRIPDMINISNRITLTEKECFVCSKLQIWITTIVMQSIPILILFAIGIKLLSFTWNNHKRRSSFLNDEIRKRLFKHTLIELNVPMIVALHLLSEIPLAALHIHFISLNDYVGIRKYDFMFKVIFMLCYASFFYVHLITLYIFRHTLKSFAETIMCRNANEREGEEPVAVWPFWFFK